MVKLKRPVLYLSTIFVVISTVLIVSSITLFIMSTMEDNRRHNIGADLTLVGKVEKAEKIREEDYTPVFTYSFKGTDYKIYSEYILCETEEEAINHKDVNVKLNSISGEAYIEECRNIRGQFYDMNSLSDKSLKLLCISAVIMILSCISMIKLTQK